MFLAQLGFEAKMNQAKDHEKNTYPRRTEGKVTDSRLLGLNLISREQTIEIRPLTILAGAE
jgi:hypothetical protein